MGTTVEPGETMTTRTPALGRERDSMETTAELGETSMTPTPGCPTTLTRHETPPASP